MVDVARGYSPAEAAVISDVALKAVHNAIDKHIVDVSETHAPKRLMRKLSLDGVLRLKLWQAVGGVLSQDRRRQLFAEIEARPTAKLVKVDTYVIVDVAEARKEIAKRTRELQAAEAAVTRSVGVMGGEPVFKGTRIPVRLIATMLDEGVDAAEILGGYPKLTSHHLKLAPMWVAAHPRRGRPKSLADRGAKVRSQSRSAVKSDPCPTASMQRPSS